MKAKPWERELGKLLTEVRTPSEVGQLIKLAQERYGVRRVPVGRDNNIGTIRMASEPGLAMVERITNGIDSLLELAVILKGGTVKPISPEAAARHLLGVPANGLVEMTGTERRNLAEKLVFSVHDSGLTSRPTVRISDRGLGQHPDDFALTLMSLNESNKVGKPYTMGTYGQGGSVTLGFSEFTVVVSHRHQQLLAGKPDLVGWTVAFEEESDPDSDDLPRYIWLVGLNGKPFSLPPDAIPDLENGTRVTHVQYDVQSLTGPFTTQLWQFLNAALFEPALPFLLTGDRKGDPRKSNGEVDDRVITGSATRLASVNKAKGDIELAAYDSHEVDLGPEYGSVEMSWWVLARPEGSTSKTDPAASYVQATNAVSLTLHGQRQDAERRSWIKDKALLPHLYKNMIVNINANGLRPKGRKELFASTRERATESHLRRLIYARLAELLLKDEELCRLNHEEKEKLLRRSTAATNEKIRKRLGKFIQTKLKGVEKPQGPRSGAGPGPGGTKQGNTKGKAKQDGGDGADRRNTDDANFLNVPTELRFGSKAIKVVQGFAGYVWVLVNAKNGYLPAHDDDLAIELDPPGGDKLRVESRSRLLGGKSRWCIRSSADAPIGQYELTVSLMTANGMLHASIPVLITEPPEPNRQQEKAADDDTGPEVRWVSKSEWDEMPSLEFDAKIVGRVTEDAESTIIWVNRDYSLLAKTLTSSKLTAEASKTRADRYQYPVACGLWLQHHEQKTADPKPEQPWLDGEMRRLAEAVLVAMDPDVELAGLEGED